MKASSFRPGGRRHVLGLVFDLGARNVLLCLKDGTSLLEGFGGEAHDREMSRDAMSRWFGQQSGLTGVGEGGLSWRGFGRMVVKDESVWLFYAKASTELLERISKAVGVGSVRFVPMSTLLEGGSSGDHRVDSKLFYLVPMAVNHARGIDDVLFYEIVLTDRNFGEGS
jgi:hypothetical protein